MALPPHDGRRRRGRGGSHGGLLLKPSNDNWNLPLYVAAAGYFGAMLCSLFIDPASPIVERHEPREAAPEPA